MRFSLQTLMLLSFSFGLFMCLNCMSWGNKTYYWGTGDISSINWGFCRVNLEPDSIHASKDGYYLVEQDMGFPFSISTDQSWQRTDGKRWIICPQFKCYSSIGEFFYVLAINFVYFVILAWFVIMLVRIRRKRKVG